MESGSTVYWILSTVYWITVYWILEIEKSSSCDVWGLKSSKGVDVTRVSLVRVGVWWGHCLRTARGSCVLSGVVNPQKSERSKDKVLSQNYRIYSRTKSMSCPRSCTVASSCRICEKIP